MKFLLVGVEGLENVGFLLGAGVSAKFGLQLSQTHQSLTIQVRFVKSTRRF